MNDADETFKAGFCGSLGYMDLNIVIIVFIKWSDISR